MTYTFTFTFTFMCQYQTSRERKNERAIGKKCMTVSVAINCNHRNEFEILTERNMTKMNQSPQLSFFCHLELKY